MALVSVNIVDDLRRRLDAVRASGRQVNLSKICQDGLRAALDEIENAAPELTAEAIAARLKSRHDPDDMRRFHGAAAGRSWARNFATAWEVRRAGEIVADGDFDWSPGLGRGEVWLPYRVYCRLHELPIEHEFASGALSFWNREVVYYDHGGMLSPAYAEAFIRAAAEVWAAVKPFMESTAPPPEPTPPKRRRKN